MSQQNARHMQGVVNMDVFDQRTARVVALNITLTFECVKLLCVLELSCAMYCNLIGA